MTRSSSRIFASLRLCALAVIAVIACVPAADAPDLIAVGSVWTGDAAQPSAQAVAVKGDTIVAVGDSAAILVTAGDGTRILRGAMVVPGLMDDHTHFISWGETLAAVDLRDAATPEEFVRRIAAFAGTLQPGEWIVGGNWDHERFPGSPLPRREWVDSVTPNNPVMVSRYDGHMVFANSAALKAAGVDRTTQDVPGGEIVRDGGEPTGIFRDEAYGLISRAVPPPSESQLDSTAARAIRDAAEHGVTGVAFVTAGWPEIAALRRALKRGTLTLRVAAYPAIADWRNAAESLRVNGPGDGMLRVAGVKGMVDGSLGSTTAWFFEPFTDAPHTTGLQVTNIDSLRSWIARSDSAGLQVVVHAIGDRANAWLLDVFDSVAKAHGARDRRFKVEHGQHLRPVEVARFAALEVQPSMQPYHVIDDGRWAAKRLGPVRTRTTYAFRSLLDAKARLAFGSDAPVAPLDPILGIYGAVTRATLDDRNPGGWVPEEKISVDEALRAYTEANGWGMYWDKTGVLKAGNWADLVVLDRDLKAIPPEEIRNAKVTATVVAGKVVYSR